MITKEEVDLFCKNYYGHTIGEAIEDMGYWMEKNYESEQKNKELHNKIDNAIEYIVKHSEDSGYLDVREVKGLLKLLKDSEVNE